MIIDYTPCRECKNNEVWYTCRMCGKCGRVFKNGWMVDTGGTHVDEEEDDDDDDDEGEQYDNG